MAEDLLNFTQKGRSANFGNVTLSFCFQEEELNYTQSDNSGEVSLRIPYERIQMTAPRKVVFKYGRQRSRSIAFFILGCSLIVLICAALRLPASSLGFAAIGMISGLMVIFYRTSGSLSYTFLDAPNTGAPSNVVKIIHDNNHDAIFDQIKTHWSAKLKKLYGQIIPANPPDRELKRFEWLKKHGVISEEEYQSAIKVIEVSAAQRNDKPEDAKSLN